MLQNQERQAKFEQGKLPEFDVLVRLAEQNPEALEKLRQDLVEQVIQSAPKRLHRRLRGLQFQIDTQCKLAGSPMAACLKISSMMHESLTELRGILNGQLIPALQGSLTDVTDNDSATTTTVEKPTASVLQFRR